MVLLTSELATKIVEQTSSKYGPYILLTIPIVAVCIGWYVKRIINKLDNANEERLASLVRHQNANAAAITALTKLHHDSQREITLRLTASFEELVAANNNTNQRLAYIEGTLKLGPDG